jgi:hypothetical protein
MAIDTKNKRASVLGATLVFLTFVPAPDGTITGADKQQIFGFYSGISTESEETPAAILGYDVTSTGNWYADYSTVYATHDTTNAYGGDTVSAYVYAKNTSATSSRTVTLGLYSDDAGNNRPQDLLTSVVITVPKSSPEGWYSNTINYTLDPNTKYWLAFISSGYTGGGFTILYLPAGGTNRGRYMSNPSLPNPWPDSGSSASTYRWLVYISYGSATPGGSVIPVLFHHYDMMRG